MVLAGRLTDEGIAVVVSTPQPRNACTLQDFLYHLYVVAEAEQGRREATLMQPNALEVFVFRHHLVYEIEPEVVRIVAFLHGASDFERWRSEAERWVARGIGRCSGDDWTLLQSTGCIHPGMCAPWQARRRDFFAQVFGG